MLPNPLMAMMNGQQEQTKRPMPGLPINPGGSMTSGSGSGDGDSFTAMEQAPPEDDVMELDTEEPAKDEETVKLDAGFVSADNHCGVCMHMTPDGTCQRYGFNVVDDDGCVEGFEPEGGEDILGGDGETSEMEEPEEMEEVEEVEE